MPHESRLTGELRALLQAQRVASLGTTDDDGCAFVSMTPYALAPGLGCLVLHVSGLAAHTHNLQRRAGVSLLVMQAEVAGAPVHALPRVTLQGRAEVLARGSALWQDCRNAYVQRFPEAEPMTALGDFMFVAVHLQGARQVAGFGAARSLDADELRRALAPAAPA